MPGYRDCEQLSSNVHRLRKHFGLWEMLVYIGIFLVGFFYVWKKGVLDWGVVDSKRGDF
jgi:hypothetical protein